MVKRPRNTTGANKWGVDTSFPPRPPAPGSRPGRPRKDPSDTPRHLDNEVIAPVYNRSSHRWACPKGCKDKNQRRAVYRVEVTVDELLYLPLTNADLEPNYTNATYRRIVDPPRPRFRVVSPALCSKCLNELVREGLCSVCNHRKALTGFVTPPDFDPDTDDSRRSNACAACVELLGDLAPPPPPPPPPAPLPDITAEQYERYIHDARAAPGRRKALLKAARRDHPDDPRWGQIEATDTHLAMQERAVRSARARWRSKPDPNAPREKLPEL